jgi:SPP1 gp7 family putative phage head morphogenesis protein
VKKGKIIYYPHVAEKSYEEDLLKFVKLIKRAVRTYIVPVVKEMNKRIDELRQDDLITDLEQAIAEVRRYINAAELLLIDTLFFRARKVGDYTTKQVLNSIKSLVSVKASDSSILVDMFSSRLTDSLEDRYKLFAAENSVLIRSIPNQMLDRLSIIIMEGYKSGKSTEDLTQEIITQFNVSENRAKLIARDQIGKLHSKIIQDEASILNIDYYIFSDSADERTRASHHAMHNKICKFSDPSVYKDDIKDKWAKRSSIGGVELHPGQDFQCRCNFIFIINNK